MEVDKLSLERIIKALVGLGLSQSDAEVYVHLATTGPATARNIMDTLAINKRQLYRSLTYVVIIRKGWRVLQRFH